MAETFLGLSLLVAAIAGAMLIFRGIRLASQLGEHASQALARDDRGRLPPGVDDTWWAIRQGALYSLAVMGLGVLLLLAPVFTVAGALDGANESGTEEGGEPGGDDGGATDPPKESDAGS